MQTVLIYALGKEGVAVSEIFQKNPRVRKIFVRNSGAGNGRANFMGAWKKCVLSTGKTHVHKIPPFRGRGYFGFWGGGGSADFIFMGARIFLNIGHEHGLLSGRKGRKHRSPHELCGKTMLLLVAT